MIRKVVVTFALAGLIAAPLPSNAISCPGALTWLGIDQGGTVVVGGSGVAINKICSIEVQGAFAATAPSCKAMYAALLTARVAGKSVTLYYSDPSITSCAQIAAWSTQPSMYFVEGPW